MIGGREFYLAFDDNCAVDNFVPGDVLRFLLHNLCTHARCLHILAIKLVSKSFAMNAVYCVLVAFGFQGVIKYETPVCVSNARIRPEQLPHHYNIAKAIVTSTLDVKGMMFRVYL